MNEYPNNEVTDLIKYNPLLKKPLLCTLSLCEEGEITDRLALECAAQEVWSDDYRQSPEVSIDILIRNGALTEQVFVDGAVYDGALEDIQLDETIPDDAVAEVCINMTEIGQHLLNAYAPETTLQTLLREKPQYHEVFLTALKTCDSECGCSRTDLESALNEMPPLQPNPDTLRREVYPQYFIDALEAAGGIVWQGAWRTTDVGKAALAQQCAA